VVDVHELAAGKLSALLSRRQARDLFDCSNLFRMDGLDRERLRLAFVVYDAMQRAQVTGQPYQTILDPPPADPRCCHTPR
jgi:predicted nucleotidyltransferase component of viral defense system